MRFLIFWSLVLTAAVASASNLDPLLVMDYPECVGRTAGPWKDRIQAFRNHHEFLRPGDPLNHFSMRIQKLNQTGQSKSCTIEKRSFDLAKKSLPIRVQQTFDQFQKNLVNLVSQDIEKQKKMMEDSQVCIQAAQELIQPDRKLTQIDKELYQKVLSPHMAQVCSDINQDVFKELELGLDDLRIAMGVAFSKTGPNAKEDLVHPKPLIEKAIQIFFPTVWKKDSYDRLKPLSDERNEVQRAKQYLKNLERIRQEENISISPQEMAQDAYFQILAEKPLLLFLNHDLNPQDLNRGLSRSIAQNTLDLDAFKKKPHQDLVLKTPYVREALRSIPEVDRGDACLMVSEVFRSLKERYEDYPTFLAHLSILFPVARGLQGASLSKAALKNITTSAKYSFVAYQGITNASLVQRHLRNAELCQATAVQSSAETKRLCRFRESHESLQSVQDNARDSLIITTILGALGRFLSH